VIRKKDSTEKGLKLLTSLRQHSTKLENTLFLGKKKNIFFKEKKSEWSQIIDFFAATKHLLSKDRKTAKPFPLDNIKVEEIQI
jgi:hypothetical protein